MRLIGLLSATAVVLLLLGKSALCQGAPDIIWQVGGNLGVPSATFSHDGQTIVTGGWDQTVKFWNVQDGRLLRTLSGHTYTVSEVQFSPDGQTLASASRDYTAKLWSVSDGRLLLTLQHPYHVEGISWSPDGTLVATASEDRFVRIWRISDGTVIRTFSFPYAFLSSVEFSPDGQVVVAGGGQYLTAIQIWRVSDGSLVRTISPNAEYLFDIDISPDGQTIASANGYRNSVQVWSVATGALLRTLTGHAGAVTAVSFSPDGQTIASGSGANEQTVKFWSAVTGQLIGTLPQHPYWVQAVEFSPDGQSLAASSYDVRLWAAPAGGLIRAIGTSDVDWNGVAYTPDGRHFVAAGSGSGSRVAVFDASDGTFVRALPAGYPSNVVLSPDGQQYVAPGYAREIEVRRFSDGAISRLLSGHTETVHSVAFSSDGQYLVSGAGRVQDIHGKISVYDCTVRVWRLSSGANERTLTDHNRPIVSVAFTRDGARFASAADDGIRLWLFAAGSLIRHIPDASRLVKFSPDGNVLLAAVGRDVYVYDGRTGDFIRALTGHINDVYALDVAPAGNVLASGDWAYDSTYQIKFWRVSDGAPLVSYDEEVGTGIKSLAFSNDGRFFGYAREDHTLVVARNPFAPRVILPGSFLLTRGVLQSGGLAELFESDDQRMVLRPGVVLSQAEAPIQLVLGGEAPMAAATELRFKLEAHASIPNISQRIALFDFAANQWEDLDSRLATTSDTVVEVVVTANPSRFIQAGTNRLRARVSYKQAGPVVSYPWSARIDQTIWLITQ